MMTYKITLQQNYPNQIFDIYLENSGKTAVIHLYQVQSQTFIDITIDGNLCVAGYELHDRTKLSLERWTFAQEYLYFMDLNGEQDPDFREYNDRYLFMYEY